MLSSGGKTLTVGDGVTAKPLPKSTLSKLDYVALPPLNLVKPDPIDENTILRNRREMVSLHQRFATSYMNQGQWLLALRELRSLVQLDPKNVPALSLMGVAHRQLSQWRLAKEAFEQAKLIDPDNEFVNQQLEILRNIIDNTADVTSFVGDTTVLQTNQPSQTGLPPQRTNSPSSSSKGNNKANNTGHDAKLPAKNPAPPPEGWWNNFWKNFNNK
jgi:tetratricopeptide (TPR) repeat protein